MGKVNIIKGNGFIITNAVIEVAATSKQDALMRALDAMGRHTRETGAIFSIEHYVTKQCAGSKLYYQVSVYNEGE